MVAADALAVGAAVMGAGWLGARDEVATLRGVDGGIINLPALFNPCPSLRCPFLLLQPRVRRSCAGA